MSCCALIRLRTAGVLAQPKAHVIGWSKDRHKEFLVHLIWSEQKGLQRGSLHHCGICNTFHFWNDADHIPVLACWSRLFVILVYPPAMPCFLWRTYFQCRAYFCGITSQKQEPRRHDFLSRG